MKTIRKIADDLGVSKQAVRNQIAKLGLQSSLQRSGNSFAIDKEQEGMIKSAFQQNALQTSIGNQSQTNDNVVDALIEQLKVKDEQIAALNAALESTTAALSTAQALHAGTIKQRLTDGSEADKPRSFFSRLFGKKEGGDGS